MKKENVFPTRRSIVPTLSLNKTCTYLNTEFGRTFYKNLKVKRLYCTYQKKGKKFYLLVSKVKIKVSSMVDMAHKHGPDKYCFNPDD